MEDLEFATELVRRLNKLLDYHEDTRVDISKLMKLSVLESLSTRESPTITVGDHGLTALGLINGLAGKKALVTAHCVDATEELLSIFLVGPVGKKQ